MAQPPSSQELDPASRTHGPTGRRGRSASLAHGPPRPRARPPGLAHLPSGQRGAGRFMAHPPTRPAHGSTRMAHRPRGHAPRWGMMAHTAANGAPYPRVAGALSGDVAPWAFTGRSGWRCHGPPSPTMAHRTAVLAPPSTRGALARPMDAPPPTVRAPGPTGSREPPTGRPGLSTAQGSPRPWHDAGRLVRPPGSGRRSLRAGDHRCASR